ncbi:hypothetical protein [Anaeromicropila herbilytica]|uniref:Uncharacterized protein n=1 Tax=Anaeromicropila herbilytica TaxID=2785025 RepID=A0A7R7EQ30_9FIRM|nr:hypothetical protein [Anaeromicropila herbilytica]BCN32417.1 hypothetical protein bsdtb5_37120 [Anaeromicropila herbilytica]
MSNRAHIMGFVGCVSYDIIHYLSRILCNMNKKVVLFDCSNNNALTNSISRPLELTESSIISYRDVDFSSNYQNELLNQYDYALIDFGINYNHDKIKSCDNLFLVTDLQLHHAINLRELYLSSSKQNVKIIIRDVIKCKIKPDYITKLIGANLFEEQYYVIYYDAMDTEYMLSCQYDNEFSFKKLSSIFKDMLYRILIDQCSLDRKEVTAALKIAEKGE